MAGAEGYPLRRWVMWTARPAHPSAGLPPARRTRRSAPGSTAPGLDVLSDAICMQGEGFIAGSPAPVVSDRRLESARGPGPSATSSGRRWPAARVAVRGRGRRIGGPWTGTGDLAAPRQALTERAARLGEGSRRWKDRRRRSLVGSGCRGRRCGPPSSGSATPVHRWCVPRDRRPGGQACAGPGARWPPTSWRSSSTSGRE